VAPLLDSNTSRRSTIFPSRSEQMRSMEENYLDLLQLVLEWRSTVSRIDARSATPILGERGGNAVFLIDGMPTEMR